MNTVSGLWGASLAYYLSGVIKDSPVLLVTHDKSSYEKISADLQFFIDVKRLAPFPEFAISPLEMVRVLPEIQSKRNTTLFKLCNKPQDNLLVLTTLPSILKKIMPRQTFLKSIVSVKKGISYSRDELLYYFDILGLVGVEFVTDKGEYSFRGDILDIFPIHEDNPVRIEFFSEEVESVYSYQLENFKKISFLDEIYLLPASELACETETLTKNISETEIKERLTNFGKFGGYFWYAPYVFSPMSSIFEYLPENTKVIFAFGDFERQVDQFYFNLEELSVNIDRKLLENFYKKSEAPLLKKDASFWVDITDEPSEKTFFQNIALKLDFQKNNIYQAVEDFILFLKEQVKNGFKIVVSVESQKFENVLTTFFKDHGFKFDIIQHFNEVSSGQLYLLKKRLSGGFIDPKNGIIVVCDFEIFGFSKKRKKETPKKDAFKTSLSDLETGDHVVHIDYGIGIFKGIHHKTIGGIEGDFIGIEYDDSEILYVPIDSINQIQKYLGIGNLPPKIHSLKSAKWSNLKIQAKKSAKKIAMDLLKLYAERKAVKGFSFKGEDSYLNILENTFEYDETEDQLSAIDDVYRDMESESPMERLICGDVGFGKTEVAIRAACKAVSCGKQVAVIAPTTILAKQHYVTFLKRFSTLPFRIDYISRFRTSKDIKAISEGLKDGKVDIIIGTHRLLSQDIHFKNLGLLVIDEEQRFGVAHKEKITNIRSNIDVLTMSATPIPRTLQLSLSGIRDISIIETPPVDRLPVITKLISKDEEIKDAILYELKRGGQLFFLDNNVQHIEQTGGWIKKLVPMARVDIAHGQMHSNLVEKSLGGFYDGETDVLVCSTIIENGIDVPNANTIIIKDAGNFGLAQLYQLKGRVGRSAMRGYCFLYVKGFNSLNPIAKKRLSIIEQLSELGSGFKISTYDLQLRGGGDILGAEQSGFVVNIGYELYLQLIEDAVNELKGGGAQRSKTEIQSAVPYFISADYVRDPKIRVNYYNILSEIKDFSEMEALKSELIDFYGEMPEAVDNLLKIMVLKNIGSFIGVVRLIIMTSKIKLIFDPENSVDPTLFLEPLNRLAIMGNFTGEFELTLAGGTKDEILHSSIKLVTEVYKNTAEVVSNS